MNAKKLVSMILALVMLLALGTSAMAEDETYTLTINTVSGHTYSVYQLLKGDVSELDKGEGTLANTTVGFSVKDGENVNDVVSAVTGKSGAELGNAAYGLINTSKTVQTVTGDGNKKTVQVDGGYYIIVDNWTDNAIDGDALSRNLVAVVGDTEVTPKVVKPDVDKKIIDSDANKALDNEQKTNTAAIGDEIEFEVTGKVPNTEGYAYYYYAIHDTLSAGLTLKHDSFEVTVGNDTLIKDTDYKVTVNGQEFTLQLKNLASAGYTADTAISIKYKATVNEKAVIGTEANTNTVKLEYSNNPNASFESKPDGDNDNFPKPGGATGNGPEHVTKTYVTELTIIKVDADGNILTGAEFTLKGTNLNKVNVTVATQFAEATEDEKAEYYKLKDGTFTKDAPSNAEEGEEGYNANLYENPDAPTHVLKTTTSVNQESTTSNTITAEVGVDGKVTFTGLNAGDYTLTETKTPEGYNTINPISFKISATVSNNSVAWSSESENITMKNGVFEVTITNYKGSTLPSTGGMGTTVLYIAGGLLVAAAVIMMITKRRAGAAE